MNEDGDRSPATSQQVGDDLRDAFAALDTASIAPEERARLQRRLLAITTSAKRDVRRAHEQLVRFRSDLRAADAANNMDEDE